VFFSAPGSTSRPLPLITITTIIITTITTVIITVKALL
jgi:hypothetical protein